MNFIIPRVIITLHKGEVLFLLPLENGWSSVDVGRKVTLEKRKQRVSVVDANSQSLPEKSEVVRARVSNDTEGLVDGERDTDMETGSAGHTAAPGQVLRALAAQVPGGTRSTRTHSTSGAGSGRSRSLSACTHSTTSAECSPLCRGSNLTSPLESPCIWQHRSAGRRHGHSTPATEPGGHGAVSSPHGKLRTRPPRRHGHFTKHTPGSGPCVPSTKPSPKRCHSRGKCLSAHCPTS